MIDLIAPRYRNTFYQQTDPITASVGIFCRGCDVQVAEASILDPKAVVEDIEEMQGVVSEFCEGHLNPAGTQGNS